MIHEEICTYEVCKLAKEKGFDVHYVSFYALENFTAEYVDDAGDFYEVDFEKGNLYLNYPIKGSLYKAKMLYAPTQSLLQRWLREEKSIHIYISVSVNDKHCFYWTLYDKRGDCWEETGMCYCEYSTYELALEDALKYALENLV